MDLQTRKLKLITFLAQMQDESFFANIEDYVLKKAKDEVAEITPLTIDELISRVQRSEEDIKAGKFKTQEELETISASW